MSPEDRVNMAVEMSSVVSTITMESILDQNPRISKARLIQEGRKRLRSGRRFSEIIDAEKPLNLHRFPNTDVPAHIS